MTPRHRTSLRRSYCLLFITTCLYLFSPSLAFVHYSLVYVSSFPPSYPLSLSLSPLLCSRANLLFIKLKEHISPRAYSNLPVWLSASQQNSYEVLVDWFHDSWSFFRQKMSTLSSLSFLSCFQSHECMQCLKLDVTLRGLEIVFARFECATYRNGQMYPSEESFYLWKLGSKFI